MTFSDRTLITKDRLLFQSAILSLCAAMLCPASGCLFMSQSTRVERDKEAMRPVQFESEQARQYYLAGVNELKNHQSASKTEVSAFPFLWLISSNSVLSNNAFFNDQIGACDTNGDGMITMQEALAYRAMVSEQVRAREKQSSSSDAKTDEHGQPTNPGIAVGPGLNSPPPPSLIHISHTEGVGP